MKLLPLFVTILLTTCARGVYAAEAFNFPPSDFEILSADSGQLIGHGHYRVEQAPGSLILHGENRYLNGEYDLEEDHLTTEPGAALPTLVTFRHDFFNADGTLLLVARLDSKTGTAICAKAEAGKLDLKPEPLKFSADTFAGASVLIPIQDFISHGDRESTLKLHVFNCAPSARLIAVDVKPEGARTWADYPGELERIDVKPNLGLWTIVIQPFIPKLAVWFDPSQNMLLVGAQLQRFYRGTKIILVRKREATISNPAAADKARAVAGAPPP
jgi:hypothetical protein